MELLPPPQHASAADQQVLRIQAEQRMHSRLAGLTINQLATGNLVIYSTHEILPPAGFRDRWHWVGENHSRGQLSDAESEHLTNAVACLLFGDIHSEEHMQRAHDLAECVDTFLGSEGPPIILVSHSSFPERQDAFLEDSDAILHILSEAVAAGISDFILGEPCGVKLACEVLSRIMQQERLFSSWTEKLNLVRATYEYARNLEDAVNDIVWEYLRIRLNTNLPRIDPDIRPGPPQTVDGLTVGTRLGQGRLGRVCSLIDSGWHSGQVLRMVEKKPLTSYLGILPLKRQLSVLHLISSEAQNLPNLTKFHQVHHTETHLLYRMAYGGSTDLYKLLVLRETECNKPLHREHASSTLLQCVAALDQLRKISVAHRDVKLQSFGVYEIEEHRICIKLFDFESAVTARPGFLCPGSSYGTFPFLAPEVILESTHDPFKADVWSLGVVFLAVLCHLSIMKKVVGVSLKVKADQVGRLEAEKAMQKVTAYFGTCGQVKILLENHLRPELADLLDDAQALLAGMLTVPFSDRWKIDRAAKACNNDLFLAFKACNGELSVDMPDSSHATSVY